MEPSASVLLVLIGVMCFGALLTGLLRDGELESAWAWAFAPVVALVIGLSYLAASLDHSPPIRFLVLDPISWPATLAFLLMVGLSMDTLRRRNLPIDQLTIRISVAASVMWVCGVASSQLPLSLPWPIQLENTACASAELGIFRAVASVTASICMLSALASRIKRRSLDLLPLAGLSAWFTSRAAIDVLGHRVADDVCFKLITANDVSFLAAAADLVSGFGLVICIACFGIAATRRTLSCAPESRSWSVLALVPTLWLFTSPSLEPTYASSVTELKWTFPGNVPRYARDRDDRMTAVLNADGELHLFQSGRHSQPAAVDVVAPPPGHADGIVVFVNPGTTFRDLRNATGVLRLFSEISLVWHANNLHAASNAARRRWPFLATESRRFRAERFSLRARCYAYYEVERWRCLTNDRLLVDATLIGEPDHVELSTWLRAPNRVPAHNATLLAPDVRQPDWTPTASEPENETQSAVLPENATSGLAGLLIALLAALGFIARELSIAKNLASSADPIEAGAATAQTHPTWVPPELATLSVKSTKATPYRGGPHTQLQLATLPTSMQELKRATTKALHQTTEATMRWVFIAVVVTALGFALPFLFAL